MQTQIVMADVTTSDDIVPIDFTIESSPLAFEILSAGIYTDRVLAPVRELMCNAIDAHADADNIETPYVVHLPNTLEPFWSVRDYGTGLPPEMVKQLYTRYFKSTKTKSNVPIGFMGLGSKSPFAYVESFNVTSYWNGVKYMYSAYRNELKMPSIALLGEEKTDEPNGMEISFSVNRYDFHQFFQKTKEALKFFERMPSVIGVHAFDFPVNDYLAKGNTYGITKKNESISYIVMANVGYEFDYTDFSSTPEALTNRERKLVEWGVHLFVPNGSVQPAASREKITWTEASRKLVKEYLSQALVYIEDQAKATLANVTTLWEARQALHAAKTGIMGSLIDSDQFVEWNGQPIHDVIHLNNITVQKPNLIEAVSIDDNAGYRYYRKRATRVGNFYHHAIDSFGCGCKVFFINDLKRGGYAGAKRYMEEKGIDSGVMFSQDVTQEYIDAIGCGHLIIKTSTLPKPPRAPRGTGGGTVDRTMLQKWDSHGSWDDVEIDLAEGGVYFEVRRNKVKYQMKGMTSYDFVEAGRVHKYVHAVRTLEGDTVDEDVYVIRPCDLSRLEKYEWITFYDYMEDVLKQNANLVDDAVKIFTLNHTNTSYVERMAKFKDQLIDGSELKKAILFHESLLEAKANEAKVNAFLVLNEYHNLHQIKKMNTDVIENLFEHYPLLRFCSNYTESSIAAAIQYIQLLDAQRAREVKAEVEAA